MDTRTPCHKCLLLDELFEMAAYGSLVGVSTSALKSNMVMADMEVKWAPASMHWQDQEIRLDDAS